MADELALAPAEGIRVIWDRAAVAAYAAGEGEPDPAWRLDGSLTPGFSALRVVSGATADGSVLLLAAARPAAAASHDEEQVAALVAGPDAGAEPIEEALVSTEYAADGSIRRIGLELYKPGDDYPMRGAGDAVRTSLAGTGAERHDISVLDFRLGGSRGVALYEIVQPG